MRRLQCGLGLAVLWVSRQLRCPKVSKGRAESPCKRHYKATLPKAVPAGGLTRRLRRGRRGCRPEGGSTFFRSERKYQRKLAARRLREKALDCPFLKEGVRNVARSTVGLPTFTFVRARARLFPPSKWAGLFPSAAYRRSAPPQVALGRLKGKPVGMLRRNLAGFAAKKQACFFHYGWHYAYSISIAWDASSRPGYSCNTKGQRDFISTLVFVASHEARRRMAV